MKPVAWGLDIGAKRGKGGELFASVSEHTGWQGAKRELVGVRKHGSCSFKRHRHKVNQGLHPHRGPVAFGVDGVDVSIGAVVVG